MTLWLSNDCWYIVVYIQIFETQFSCFLHNNINPRIIIFSSWNFKILYIQYNNNVQIKYLQKLFPLKKINPQKLCVLQKFGRIWMTCHFALLCECWCHDNYNYYFRSSPVHKNFLECCFQRTFSTVQFLIFRKKF